MKALQIAFITDKLELTSEESQKFWPIHNAYEQKLAKRRANGRKSNNVEEMTDAEAMKFVYQKIEGEEMAIAARKLYVEDLKPVLPPKKIALLFMIENDFKRKMLKNMREHRTKKGVRNE